MISSPMSPGANSILVAGQLAIVSFGFYASCLDLSPGAFNHLEMSLVLEAHAIASSGRDLEGRLLPLYFHISDTLWFQPVPVYFTALLFRLLPVAEIDARWPTAIVGAIDVVLMYLIARKLLGREPLAILAACLRRSRRLCSSSLVSDPVDPSAPGRVCRSSQTVPAVRSKASECGQRTQQTTELCKPDPAFRDLLAVVQSIFSLLFRRFESDECHASGRHLFASRCRLFGCWNCPASQSSAAALQSRHLVRFSLG